MKRLFVLHNLPLEYYPPVTNFLSLLERKESMVTHVFSVHENKALEVFDLTRTKIFRTKHFAYTQNPFKKIFRLLKSILIPFYLLIKFKPDLLIYFEPHSAFPAFLYKKFINNKVELYIHNHEYYEPKAFLSQEMKTVRFFHKLEEHFLYRNAKWISQTNKYRLKLFKKEYPFLKDEQLHILSNYPPKSWVNENEKPISNGVIKLVYFGALSFENTYIREITEFVISNVSSLFLDIYSFNLHEDVKTYLKQLKSKNVILYENGIAYEKIPSVIVNYDVGLVLHKAHNINYRYNAPNKLFEYLVSGLEVWFSEELEGCHAYLNNQTRPQVKALNFNKLDSNIIENYYEGDQLPRAVSDFNSESELQKLINAFEK